MGNPHKNISIFDALSEYSLKELMDDFELRMSTNHDYPFFYIYIDGDGELMLIGTRDEISTKDTYIVDWFKCYLCGDSGYRTEFYTAAPTGYFIFRNRNVQYDFTWASIALNKDVPQRKNDYCYHLCRFYDPADEEDFKEIEWIVDNIATLESI